MRSLDLWGASPLLKFFNGEMVVGSFLILLGVVSFGMPNVTSVLLLHGLYFISGIGMGLMDAGPNILMDKLLTARVGPWLIALQLAFDFGGFLGVLIELVFKLNEHELFYVVGSILTALGISLITLAVARRFIWPDFPRALHGSHIVVVKPVAKPVAANASSYAKVVPVDEQNSIELHRVENGHNSEEKLQIEENRSVMTNLISASGKNSDDNSNLENNQLLPPPEVKSAEKSDLSPTKPANYYSDICLSFVIFLLIGSSTAATAYVPPYAIETGIESENQANWQVCLIWLALTLGLLFSLLLRKYVFSSSEAVPYLFTVFTALSVVGCLLMLVVPKNAQNKNLLWISLIMYGFFLGPGVGLAFEHIPTVTYATETSYAIASLGLNIGCGVLPYIVTALWENGVGPKSLFIVLTGSLAISIPLFYTSTFVSCKLRDVKNEPSQKQESP